MLRPVLRKDEELDDGGDAEQHQRAEAGAERTWVYRFDRSSPKDAKRGAAHTDDIPYVFGTLDAKGSYLGTDAAARRLSAAMMQAFTGLAKTGRPGLADWRTYRLPERGTMIFDETIRMEDDPRGWERSLWATAPYVQPGS